MEALLFGDDGDDSDDETGPDGSLSSSMPAAAAVGTSAPAPSANSQSDLSARLKSLYSPSINKPPSNAPPLQNQHQLTHHQQHHQRQIPPQMQRMPSQPLQPTQQQVPPQMQPQMQRHHSHPMQSSHHVTSSSPSHHQSLMSSSSSRSQGGVPQNPGSSASMMQPPQQRQPAPILASRRVPDPFEPTPLTAYNSHASSSQSHQQQQQPTLPRSQPPQPTPIVAPLIQSPHGVATHGGAPLPSQHPAADRALMDAKKAKEQFLLFTRVLMKYLENKDPEMHANAKYVIRECAEKNKRKEAGYESVTASMKARLKQTVGDAYWKKAEGYLLHFQQRRNQSLTTATVSSPQLQQQQQQQPPPSHSVRDDAARELERKREQEAAMQKKMLEKQEHDRRMRERMEEAERRKKTAEQQQQQKKLEQESLKADSLEKAQLQKQQEAQAKLQQIRESNAIQMAALKAQTSKQRAAAAAAATTPSASKRKGSSSSVSSASRTKSTAATLVTAAGPAASIELDAPPQEYSELMEMLEQAVDHDWTTAGLLLANRTDIDLNAEQRALLYGKTQPMIPTDHKIRPGWNDRNIISARTAWAKVRLPELYRELKASQSAAPVVAGVALPNCTQEADKTGISEISTSKMTWLNEETAEMDPTLAVLSEATNIYLRQVLDKALQCARQRENLEGIRLWHMQYSGTKPPIAIRLGCDVSRQVALSAGNSARIVQRMEEALDRNPVEKGDINDNEVIAKATCMGDLACRPRLASAIEKADFQAKRSFEISGGKDSKAPPFGRVPKKAKIMVHDFHMGVELSNQPTPRAIALHFI